MARSRASAKQAGTRWDEEYVSLTEFEIDAIVRILAS